MLAVSLKCTLGANHKLLDSVQEFLAEMLHTALPILDYCRILNLIESQDSPDHTFFLFIKMPPYYPQVSVPVNLNVQWESYCHISWTP